MMQQDFILKLFPTPAFYRIIKRNQQLFAGQVSGVAPHFQLRAEEDGWKDCLINRVFSVIWGTLLSFSFINLLLGLRSLGTWLISGHLSSTGMLGAGENSRKDKMGDLVAGRIDLWGKKQKELNMYSLAQGQQRRTTVCRLADRHKCRRGGGIV